MQQVQLSPALKFSCYPPSQGVAGGALAQSLDRYRRNWGTRKPISRRWRLRAFGKTLSPPGAWFGPVFERSMEGSGPRHSPTAVLSVGDGLFAVCQTLCAISRRPHPVQPDSCYVPAQTALQGGPSCPATPATLSWRVIPRPENGGSAGGSVPPMNGRGH